MSVLDKVASDSCTCKKAADWTTYLGLTAAALASLGAIHGWNVAAANNPFSNELNNIKRRNLLTALNSPEAPLLTVTESRKKKREEEKKEVNGDYTSDK